MKLKDYNDFNFTNEPFARKVKMKKEIKILKALANEKRLEILKLLKKNPGLSVVQIAKEIDLHFKSTSKHLQKLSEAGLVESNRDGVWVRFELMKRVDRLFQKIDKL